MKRIAIILILVSLIVGCDRFKRKDHVIQPDEEAPITPPTTQPAKNPVAGTEPQPKPLVSTRPSPYKVLSRSEVVTAAALQVNDKFITIDQVLSPAGAMLTKLATGANEKTFRAKALGLIREQIRNQVEHVLLLSEAENFLTDPEKDRVAEEVADNLRQAVAEMGGSKVRFDQHLRSKGTDLETWLKQLNEALLIRSYMQSRLGRQIVVSRRMMWNYYVTHRQEFSKPDRVQMQIISAPIEVFLPTGRDITDADRQEARSKAKALADKAAGELAKGKKFDDVAKKSSRGPMASSGGTWPMMERGSFRAEAVEETAFAQGAGRTSGIIETPRGFYIVRTLSVKPGKKSSFEDVAETITNKLRRQQFGKLAQEYRVKLYTKAVIIAPERFERIALEKAVQKYYQKLKGHGS
jgi:hypothetical protein